MADLSTKSFTTFVQDFATAVQGSSAKLVDFTIGSILRALAEATAGVGLWLQGLILQLLATTRASTSTGSDLDTWLADFGFEREAAGYASGSVTLSRITPTAQAVVPVGSIVQTSDSTQFVVGTDTTNAAYDATQLGYVLAAGTYSVSVPVTASVAGTTGNVTAGEISELYQSITGVDSVTNPLAFTNGTAAETDAAALTRFQLWISSLSKAVEAAIESAIEAIGTNITYTLVENVAYGGTSQPGYFYVVIDDGTGSPPSTTLDTVRSAIEAVRGLTIGYGVFAPVVVSAAVSMTITTSSAYDHATVVSEVSAALLSYINALTLGQSLNYSRLAQIAYDASAGVTNVTGVLLNSGTSDVSATAKQVVKATSSSISVS